VCEHDYLFIVIGEDARIDRDSQHKKLVIMIAGETARADRFSLNGYQRLTNPLLTKESVLSFSQMSSCGTDTAYSLPCIQAQICIFLKECSVRLKKHQSNHNKYNN
jgi:lipid A ethanolaminephosphotransferase